MILSAIIKERMCFLLLFAFSRLRKNFVGFSYSSVKFGPCPYDATSCTFVINIFNFRFCPIYFIKIIQSRLGTYQLL